jgi:hypothetical protein
MATMTRPSRFMSETMGRHEGSAISRHPVTTILGMVFLGMLIASFVSMLPDFLRYMKLRQM